MDNLLIKAKVEKGDFQRGGEVSSKLKTILTQLDLESQFIRRASIITYELEMNMIIHSEGGQILSKINPNTLVIIADDKGPGIEDVELALTPGFSTAGESIRELGFGAGMGLCNVNKFADRLQIKSSKKEGSFIKVKLDI